MIRVFALTLCLAAAAWPAHAQRGSTAPGVAPSTFGRSSVGVDPVDTLRGTGETDLRGALSQDNNQTGSRVGTLAGEVYDQTVRGDWVRRGEIVVVSTREDIDAAAQALGLTLKERTALSASGLFLSTWRTPSGANPGELATTLQQALPQAAVDLNHIYAFQPATRGRAVRANAPASRVNDGRQRTAAMIGSGAPVAGPGLEGVNLRTRRIPPGESRQGEQAQAVAELLAASAGRADLTLLAADVAEGGPVDGATVTSLILAAEWAVSEGAEVIEISMTGPANNALGAALGVISRSGVKIVAAADNGGPQAGAPYPAAMPWVIGVTAVDRRLNSGPRATPGEHVDFAGNGVDVSAAGHLWTGAAIAAPVVAGLILRDGAAREDLAAHARDLGAPGRDPVFGYGYLSADPAEMTAR